MWKLGMPMHVERIPPQERPWHLQIIAAAQELRSACYSEVWTHQVPQTSKTSERFKCIFFDVESWEGCKTSSMHGKRKREKRGMSDRNRAVSTSEDQMIRWKSYVWAMIPRRPDGEHGKTFSLRAPTSLQGNFFLNDTRIEKVLRSRLQKTFFRCDPFPINEIGHKLRALRFEGTL